MGSADADRREDEHPRMTWVTRQALVDLLTLEPKFYWTGNRDAVAFLGALFDLTSMPSYDRRYSNAAGDIRQHCINNNDWDEAWVFSDPRFNVRSAPESDLLRFLERSVHPGVRESEVAVEMVAKINKILAPDGFELAPDGAISGRTVYTGRQLGSFHGDRPQALTVDRATLGDRGALDRHLSRIQSSIRSDPATTIGSCKELLESTFVQILDARGVPHRTSDDLPTLYKAVSRTLDLAKESVGGHTDGSAAVTGLLRGLASSVQSIGELRNKIGTRHGRSTPSPADPRHARLALNATVAITEYLFDTWESMP